MTFPEEHPRTRRLLERILGPSRLDHSEGQRARLVERLLERDAFPLAYRYARTEGLEIGDELEEAWRRHRVRVAFLRRELGRVLECLPDDLPVAVLKGESLSHQLFGEGTLRTSADIDLLLPEEEISRALGCMTSHGYESVDYDVPEWTTNQVGLRHGESATWLELHWRLAMPPLSVPEEKEWTRRLETVEMEGRDVPVLDPETTFLHLCYHFHQHRGFLKGLLDIAGWLDTFEPTADLARIRRQAERLGVRGLIQWPIRTLQRWIGVESALLEPTADPFVRAWVRWNVRQLRRLYVELDSGTPWLSQWRKNGDTWSTKVSNTLAEALSMTVLDEPGAKMRAALHPLYFGPHAIGRAVTRLVGRSDSLLE